MLTKLTVRNFKRFEEFEIELNDAVLFIGPNNSGKTSAMQALALWEAGLRFWNEKRPPQKDEQSNKKAKGVTLNRYDLVSIPVPEAILLWRELHVRDVKRDSKGKQTIENIRIDVIVEGTTEGEKWKCGFEFDYSNSEAFFCRPLRNPNGKGHMLIPKQASTVDMAFLPPMSGLVAKETRMDTGAINVRIGEGRTAEVLRNLCYKLYEKEDKNSWEELVEKIKTLFGVTINPPIYIIARGEISMTYKEVGSKVKLDLSCAGRGMQQTLLIWAYMYSRPGAILLLDEPDAHLETLRQRQIYELIIDTVNRSGGQLIAASHSEVLLSESADRDDTIVSFIGKNPRTNKNLKQINKALKTFGFEHYLKAQQTGWVLYLEGSTDLAILQAFAKQLDHKNAMKALQSPFVQYVADQPKKAKEHFQAIRDAYPALYGIALFDRLEKLPESHKGLQCLMWNQCEIENYFCFRETLDNWVEHQSTNRSLFSKFNDEEMRKEITKLEDAFEMMEEKSPWGPDAKVSDDFLTRLFNRFFKNKKIKMPRKIRKNNFHELVTHTPVELISNEVKEKLDAIAEVHKQATKNLESN